MDVSLRAAERAGSAPSRVALIGLMGAGKSSVGRRLARRLGWEFVDMDAEIARGARRGVARIFVEQGEAEFRRREAALLSRLARRRKIVVAAGGGVILQSSNRRLLRGRFLTFHLQVSADEAWRRLGTARGRPLLSARGGSDPGSPPRRLRRIAAERNRLYASVGTPIRTTGFAPVELARRLARRLGVPAAPGRTAPSAPRGRASRSAGGGAA
jgi:shikimate kinase